MTPYRSPGVYLKEAAEHRFVKVEAVSMSATAFLGFAQRGPLYVPQRLTSFAQFRELYGGFLPGIYLAHAVFGFFANGGRECYVIRIARVAADGTGPGAARSSLVVQSLGGVDLLAITASSEGTWGARIKVEIGEPRRPTESLLVVDVPPGTSSARVKSTRGFGPGDAVTLGDGATGQRVRLTGVVGNELRWSPAEAARSAVSATDRSRVTALEFRLVLSFESIVEEFDHLSTDALSERYFVRLINGRSRLVTVEDLRAGGEPSDLPQPATGTTLHGGEDGLDDLSASDFVGFDAGPDTR